MNTLREAIDDYVAMRRGLGFKLVQMECWLRDFAAFMDAQGAACVTAELALQWAMKPADVHPSCWAKRLTAVRCLRATALLRTRVPRFPRGHCFPIAQSEANRTFIARRRLDI